MTSRVGCRGRRRHPTAALEAGQPVELTAGVLRGRRGTLVRPARVVLDDGWVVAFEGRPLGLRRLRVASWALRPSGPVGSAPT